MNDLFDKLPEFDPHPDLWARIEADLDSDETLARVVGELPQYEPRTNLWEAVTDDLTPIRPLPQQPEIRVPARIRPLWAGLAAAAVLVLVGTWLVLRPETTETVRMEYAVEQAVQPSEVDRTGASSAADERAEAFINRQCAEQELVCQRPDVHELRSQLTNLAAEQTRIERERLTFGDDPVLVRAQVKIENHRAELTKELITLLRS